MGYVVVVGKCTGYIKCMSVGYDLILNCCSDLYVGRTESHEQLFFACELGTADEGECSGRWNQLLCYP